ncbi:MAG: hypothetical protein HYX86_05085, partial [Chloroflexi bacterium]|nr:hypothetical protein [Chloroflexota bacterium]
MGNSWAKAIEKIEGVLFFAFFLLSFLVFWQFGPEWQPVGLDPGMQVYIGQEMLRGHPPYLAVIFPKTPLTAMISGLAILLGDPFAIPDIISVRWAFLVIGALGVGLTFLLCRDISPQIAPRLAAAFTLLSISLWGFLSAASPEP